jgi:hypothetical protein
LEEGEYRSTYHNVNRQRCVFEKSVLSRRAGCSYAHRFCLADREGVSCQDKSAQALCKNVLDKLRENALFALQIKRLDGPLPHAKEMKVQLGGLAGMQQALKLRHDSDETIKNIHHVISSIIREYGEIEALPYIEIARAVSAFKSRKRARSIRD